MMAVASDTWRFRIFHCSSRRASASLSRIPINSGTLGESSDRVSAMLRCARTIPKSSSASTRSNSRLATGPIVPLLAHSDHRWTRRRNRDQAGRRRVQKSGEPAAVTHAAPSGRYYGEGRGRPWSGGRRTPQRSRLAPSAHLSSYLIADLGARAVVMASPAAFWAQSRPEEK